MPEHDHSKHGLEVQVQVQVDACVCARAGAYVCACRCVSKTVASLDILFHGCVVVQDHGYALKSAKSSNTICAAQTWA